MKDLGVPFRVSDVCADDRAATLADVEIGRRVRVTLLSGVDQSDLVGLAGIGILPGVDVTVIRRTPTLCVDVDGACFALDKRLAKGVVVERSPAELR